MSDAADKLFERIEYAVLAKAGGYGHAQALDSAKHALRGFVAFAQKYIDTINAVDNRCMAADGPVTPTCDEITDNELRALYEAARAAIAAA